MQIGIIFYSRTGVTRKFAGIIAKSLQARKHTTEFTDLKTDKPVEPEAKKEYEFANLPDCSAYDAVLVGGPVWAFSACPVVLKAITEIKGLKGKKASSFATMAFPLAFMGGSRAVGQMNRALAARGAKTFRGRVAPKLLRDQARLMKKAADEFAAGF